MKVTFEQFGKDTYEIRYRHIWLGYIYLHGNHWRNNTTSYWNFKTKEEAATNLLNLKKQDLNEKIRNLNERLQDVEDTVEQLRELEYCELL